MILGCGGGGGGGGSTTTFNGVIFDAVDFESPAPSATVELWQDGLVMLETDQTDVDGVFSLVGSDIVGVDIFFKVYKDPGHVPYNTQLHTVPAAGAFAETIYLPLISENLALQLGSAVWGVSESSWNDTVNGYAYVVFDVERSSPMDTTPGGVTFLETGAAGAILNSTNIWYNQGDDTFSKTNMTSPLDSAVKFPAAAARLTTQDAPSPGVKYSFRTLNHPDGDAFVQTVDAYLIPGEITEVSLEPND